MMMAAAFILPYKVKKPYLAGKIGLVFTGVIEFVILLMGLGFISDSGRPEHIENISSAVGVAESRNLLKFKIL